MGIRDVLTGRSKLKGPAPERLFAITTAYVTLQSEYEIRSSGVAAIVFQPLSTADFESTLRDVEQLVAATCEEAGTSVSHRDDGYGFRWTVVHGPELESLVVGLNAVSDALESGGYGERVLAAVFAFEDAKQQRIYLIYNYKRGFWYPFVPVPGSDTGDGGERSTERELQLKAQLANELPLEPELERWFPLWGIPI